MIPRPTVDILIPVYEGNTADAIANGPKIHAFCVNNLKKIRWRITLAYNGPKEGGIKSLVKLSRHFPHVRVTQVRKPGKGSAILNGILESPADYVVYMDADLATDLDALPLLVHTVLENDLVSGSRYHPRSIISRDILRLIVSWIYTKGILRFFLGARFTDPQCGFKVLRRKTMSDVLMRVEDAWFFFETEFTYRAQQKDLRIVEIPIRWNEQTNSSVKLVPTIINFLGNIARIKWSATSTPPHTPQWFEHVHIIRDANFHSK